MTDHKKVRLRSEWLKRAGLFICSFIFSLLLGEGICRIIFSPVDILSPELVKDPILAHRINPGSGGHDAWGFRNASVPDSVDVVVIGDSQTWGVNAALNETFPSQLGKLTGESIYNLGISGYGPVHYQYLLENKALKLKPKKVIVALYMGNDFKEAYSMVYQFEYWKNLRSEAFEKAYDKRQSKLFTIEEGNFYALRYWLNHHSIFYRLVKDKMDVLMTSLKENDSNYIHYENKALNIDKFFNPYSRLSVMDYNDPSIREGLRITLICIDNMARACSENNIDLRVVIIPSDITVYAEFLYQNNSLKDSDKFDAIIESEKTLKDSITSGLKERHIRYVDVVDSLKKHVSDKIYPKLEEGHPSPVGYHIIAEALAAEEKLPPQPR